MTGSCLCGDVRVTVGKRPDFIHDCNCTLCRKTGAGWGYYAPDSVHVKGLTMSTMRRDTPYPAAEVHSCANCAATTHFVMARSFIEQHGPATMMGVNMPLFDQQDITGVEVRFPDGLAWSGDGPFGYRREPVMVGGKVGW